MTNKFYEMKSINCGHLVKKKEKAEGGGYDWPSFIFGRICTPMWGLISKKKSLFHCEMLLSYIFDTQTATWVAEWFWITSQGIDLKIR